MEAIYYSDAKANLTRLMENVCDNHEPIIITRKKARPVIVISLDDFNAWRETQYLMESPANVVRLRKSIKQTGKRHRSASVTCWPLNI